MSDVDSPPPKSNFVFSAIGIIGCFLIFVIILLLAYVPNRNPDVDAAAGLTKDQRQEEKQLTPEDRLERLRQMHETEQEALNHYHWIDREKKTVELPIEQAMALTVQEWQAKQHQQPAGAK